MASKEMQSYQNSLNALKKHPEIYKMEDELKALQTEIMKKRTNPENDTTNLLSIYQEKRSLFENHPLVSNYLSDKEALESLIRWVQEAIEGQLGA